jgi:hypothetical protein
MCVWQCGNSTCRRAHGDIGTRPCVALCTSWSLTWTGLFVLTERISRVTKLELFGLSGKTLCGFFGYRSASFDHLTIVFPPARSVRRVSICNTLAAEYLQQLAAYRFVRLTQLSLEVALVIHPTKTVHPFACLRLICRFVVGCTLWTVFCL